jgi:hypothetical protein
MGESDDRLADMFRRQEEFMQLLKDNDRIPEWPLDLTTKQGQRLIKETLFNMGEELHEASHTLKNRMHRLTDARVYDREHYVEELGDAWAYFMEVLILSGVTPEEFHREYVRKNAVVIDRLQKGY